MGEGGTVSLLKNYSSLRIHPMPYYLKGGISIGKPTLMKNLAKDWESCSLYGGSNRTRSVRLPI